MLPVAPLLTKAIFLTALLANRFINENVLVRLSHGGTVRGSILRSEEGRPFYAFRGIRYAEPPVGHLRFKAPVPKAAWIEVAFDATKDGPVCVQFDTLIKKRLRGEEDCLTINVYTTKLPQETTNYNFTKKAVMVFIHGGGFVMGDGTSQTYNPSRLIDSDIVLVTFNYRLDALGFLSTEDSSSPGNYGMLDQVLALQWIQDNIELFGGDAESVTIFGESAGGASVSYHLLSPLSKGLFHRAIAMSGSSLGPWAHSRNPLHWAKFVANVTSCPTEPTLDLVNCLRTLPAKSLVKGLSGFAGIPYPLPFCPTTDGHFLPSSPKEIMKSRDKVNHVPLMSGVTTDEAAVFLWSDFFLAAVSEQRIVFHHPNMERYRFSETTSQQKVTYAGGEPSFQHSLKITSRVVRENMKHHQINFTVSSEEFIEFMFTSALSNRKPEVVKMIVEEYFSNVNREKLPEVERAIIDASSDGMFDFPHYEEVDLLTEAGVPVYAYSYDYQADIYTFFGLTREYGTSHGEDLFMLFDIQWLGEVKLKPKDRKMQKIMTKLWTNFAKTGNPTPDGSDSSLFPKWAPSERGEIRIHHITQPMVVTMYEPEEDARFKFWTDIIPKTRYS